uniref:Transmembrane protein with metallophosphoesterase domain n=1 Tax=Danio rerio TaxID=7955 RepID=TMPPE_DANRE|nr:transmembrane protein with metallophosphoesterase domain [Danio rerio]Q08BG1.1 RecName: Full=Transmembrane protein with metallophosphoesterase domain [Danio rerio]AAI24739.1 Zgc:153790 [Danio rerio]|eukprot:NP_001073512.1 transmembrane protein with metallophosphoesterase domain [Danio rerio]
MFGFGRLSAEGKVGIASGVVFFSMLISRTLISERVDKGTRALLFRVQFLLFINSLLLLGSLYLWKRVVKRLCGARAAPSVPQRCWRIIVLLFLALVHGSYLCMFFLVDTEPHWLSLLSFSCLGVYVILLFFLFVFGCLNRLGKLLSRSRSAEEAVASGSFRQTVLALIITAVLAVYGLVNAAQPPKVVDVEIPVEKLPESLNGLRLVLLSDIHLGPTVGRSKLQRIVSMVNELNPDVVVIVGDLTDSQVSRLRSAAEPLGQMKPRLGSYFATGNHDYYTADVEGWFELLHSMGIEALHNSHAKVFRPERTEDWICLAGIDDLEARMLRYPGHGMDVEKALNGCTTEGPIILLAHQPHAAKQALQQRPDISLVLSGHTHAGQLFPLTILAFLMNPFFCGLYRVSEHTMVYVTPGTGYYGIPMRIASRSEITNIVLKQA